jgi:hypothetical protein
MLPGALAELFEMPTTSIAASSGISPAFLVPRLGFCAVSDKSAQTGPIWGANARFDGHKI